MCISVSPLRAASLYQPTSKSDPLPLLPTTRSTPSIAAISSALAGRNIRLPLMRADGLFYATAL